MSKLWYGMRLEWMGLAISNIAVLVFVILKKWFDVDPGMAAVVLSNISSVPGLLVTYAANILEMEITMKSVERVLQLEKAPVEQTEEVMEQYFEPPETWPTQGKIELQNYKFRYREGLPACAEGRQRDDQRQGEDQRCRTDGEREVDADGGALPHRGACDGVVLVDGVDITTVPLPILRKRMCILPQEATVFSGTIKRNLDPEVKTSDEEMKR